MFISESDILKKMIKHDHLIFTVSEYLN